MDSINHRLQSAVISSSRGVDAKKIFVVMCDVTHIDIRRVGRSVFAELPPLTETVHGDSLVIRQPDKRNESLRSVEELAVLGKLVTATPSTQITS